MAMLVAAYAGLTASAFEVIKVGVEGAAERKLPLLGPMAEALSGRFLRFVEVGGAGAGAVGMWIAVGVDFFNGMEAWKEGELGMMTLYAARLVPEGALGLSMGYSLITLIVDGAAAELLGGPVVWILTGCIVIVSIIIDLTKDPATLKWARHCYFGENPDYVDDPRGEHKDFLGAIAEH